MIEPFFGSSAPIWPAVPRPAFGLSVPMPAGNRTMTFGVANAVQPERYDLAGGLMSPLAGPWGGNVPFLGTPEFAVTPAAVLAAVAMRRGQPLGPTNDQEVEELIYDVLELLPGSSEVEVRCEGGRVTLTGPVQQKRIKRDVGEIAWAIPPVNDVQNNLTIAARRRARSPNRERETEPPTVVGGRKQA